MSSGQESVLSEYEAESSQTSKLLRKFKETPFVPIGETKRGKMGICGQSPLQRIDTANTVARREKEIAVK